MRTRGRGVKNGQFWAYVLYGWPLSAYMIGIPTYMKKWFDKKVSMNNLKCNAYVMNVNYSSHAMQEQLI